MNKGVSYMSFAGIRDRERDGIKFPVVGEISIHQIIDIVSDYFLLSKEAVMGKRRDAEIVRARHICFYLLQKTKRLTLKRIGDVMGGFDHTTVLFGVNRLKELMENEEQLKIEVLNIAETVRGKMLYPSATRNDVAKIDLETTKSNMYI